MEKAKKTKVVVKKKKSDGANSYQTKTSITEQEMFAYFLGKLCLTKKAKNVVVIDIRHLQAFTDFLIIVSVDSDRQAKAVSDVLLKGAKEEGERPAHLNIQDLSWIVQDYVDVVVHIFLEEKRKFYNLERLWGDGNFIEISESSSLIKPAKAVGHAIKKVGDKKEGNIADFTKKGIHVGQSKRKIEKVITKTVDVQKVKKTELKKSSYVKRNDS